MTHNKVGYIEIEVISKTGFDRKGLLDTYNPVVGSLKIIEKSTLDSSWANLKHYTISQITVQRGSVVNNSFYSRIDKDQQDAVKLIGKLALELAEEGASKNDMEFYKTYVNIPDDYLVEDYTNNKKITIINSGKNNNNSQHTNNTNSHYPNNYAHNVVAGPTCIKRVEPLKEKTLQSIKSFVSSLRKGVIVKFPDLDNIKDQEANNYYDDDDYAYTMY